LNIFLIEYYWWFNFLPFISCYFLVNEILKERSVTFNKRYIFLAPIVALGFIPIHVKGIFSEPLKNLLTSVLFSQPAYPIVKNAPTVGSQGTSIGNIINNANTLGKELLWNSPKLVAIVTNIFSVIYIFIIYFIIREFLIVGKSKNKRLNYLEFLFIGLIGILTFAFSESYRSLLLVLDRIEVNQSYQGLSRLALYGTILITIIAFVIYVLIIKKRSSVDQLYFFNNQEPLIASFVGVTIIAFVAFLFLSLFKVFGRNVLGEWYVVLLLISIVLAAFFTIVGIISSIRSRRYEILTEIFSDENVSEFEELIAKKGVLKSLEEIKDSKAYAMFMYFSVLYLLASKGFRLMQFETPNEFLIRVEEKISVPHFRFLTNVFNKLRYSNEELTLNEFEVLKSYSKEIIVFAEDYK